MSHTSSGKRPRGGPPKVGTLVSLLKSAVKLFNGMKQIAGFRTHPTQEKVLKQLAEICRAVAERYSKDQGQKATGLIDHAIRLGENLLDSFVTHILRFMERNESRWETIERTLKVADPTILDLDAYTELQTLKGEFNQLLDGAEGPEDKIDALLALIAKHNEVSEFLNVRILKCGKTYRVAESDLRREKLHERNMEVSGNILRQVEDIEALIAA